MPSKSYENAVLGSLEMVQAFSNTNQKHVSWKTFKVSKVLAVLQEYNFYNIEWLEVCKMSEISWANLYCKMSDLLS